MECVMGVAHVACNGVCVCVWEPLENLIHCDKALDNYYMKLDLIDDSSFLRRLVNIIRRNKKLPHDEGEFY